jgi:hypothetical protein
MGEDTLVHFILAIVIAAAFAFVVDQLLKLGD